MDKLNPNQIQSIGELLASEAMYLRNFNWIPIAPITNGAPVFWKDPIENEEFSQDVAIAKQKSRVVDLLYRNYK